MIFRCFSAHSRAFLLFWLSLALVSHYIFMLCAMLQGGNFIVRRTYLEQAGGFDTSIEFMVRILMWLVLVK